MDHFLQTKIKLEYYQNVILRTDIPNSKSYEKRYAKVSFLSENFTSKNWDILFRYINRSYIFGSHPHPSPPKQKWFEIKHIFSSMLLFTKTNMLLPNHFGLHIPSFFSVPSFSDSCKQRLMVRVAISR